MKYSASLAAIASATTAQTVTLQSFDYFGNTLATATGSFTPGQEFSVELDLSVAEWSLRELRLQVGSYGASECKFYMPSNTGGEKKKGHKKVEVGKFQDMCDWPNVSAEGVMYLNVENIPQLRNPSTLTLKCMATEITFAAVKENLPCATGKPTTVENNQLANPTEYFWFMPIYKSKGTFIHDTVGIYLFNFADIFLRGWNPALDLAMIGGNAGIYEKNAKDILKAYGVIPNNPWTQATQPKYHHMSERDIVHMTNTLISFGEDTYYAELLFAAYPMVRTFLDDGVDGLNDIIFNTGNTYEDTLFHKLFNSGLTKIDSPWEDLKWWYYLELLSNETSVITFMAFTHPKGIIQWWPRLLRATYLFALAFYEESA